MPLLTSQQLAAELGFTAKRVRRLALRGLIPALKFSHEWRFDLDAVRQAATYTDPITLDAQRAARRAWIAPRRRRA